MVITTDVQAMRNTLAACKLLAFLARDVIYISRLCYDISVRLSVRLSVTEVHWHIIANLGFKFRSRFTAHVVEGRGNLNNISRYANYC